MSRRQVLADATRAAGVRKVQEQAALMRLRVQQKVASEAEDRLGDLVETHADCEAAWTAVLQPGRFDPLAAGLWRTHTEAARAEVLQGEQSLAAENGVVRERRQDWALQLQLAEAVESVRGAAARTVRRADDERRLLAVEDTGHGRRRRP